MEQENASCAMKNTQVILDKGKMQTNKRDMVAHRKKMNARVFLLKTLCENGNVLVTRGTKDDTYITTLIYDTAGGARYAEFGYEHGFSVLNFAYAPPKKIGEHTNQIDAIKYHMDYLSGNG